MTSQHYTTTLPHTQQVSASRSVIINIHRLTHRPPYYYKPDGTNNSHTKTFAEVEGKLHSVSARGASVVVGVVDFVPVLCFAALADTRLLLINMLLPPSSKSSTMRRYTCTSTLANVANSTRAFLLTLSDASRIHHKPWRVCGGGGGSGIAQMAYLHWHQRLSGCRSCCY